MEFQKAFGAIATLQREGFASRNTRELLFQTACFARKNQRRKIGKRMFDFFKRGEVFIDRHLFRFFAAPAVG
jgi:hypothetical protein